jgi:hypothetical protein
MSGCPMCVGRLGLVLFIVSLNSFDRTGGEEWRNAGRSGVRRLDARASRRGRRDQWEESWEESKKGPIEETSPRSGFFFAPPEGCKFKPGLKKNPDRPNKQPDGAEEKEKENGEENFCCNIVARTGKPSILNYEDYQNLVLIAREKTHWMGFFLAWGLGVVSKVGRRSKKKTSITCHRVRPITNSVTCLPAPSVEPISIIDTSLCNPKFAPATNGSEHSQDRQEGLLNMNIFSPKRQGHWVPPGGNKRGHIS